MKAIFEPYMHIVNVAHSAQVLMIWLDRTRYPYGIVNYTSMRWREARDGTYFHHRQSRGMQLTSLPEVLTREPGVCAVLYITYGKHHKNITSKGMFIWSHTGATPQTWP